MLVNVFYGQDKRCEHCTTVRVNPGDKQLRLALPVENLRHLGFCFGDAGKFTFGGVEVQGEMRLHLPANAFLDYRGMKKVEYGDDDEVTVWPTKDNPHIHYGELFDIPCRGCGFRFLGFLPVVGMLLGFVALVLLGLCHFSRLAVGYQVTLLLLVSLRVLFTCSLPMLNFGSCWDDGWAMKCAQSFCNGEWMGEYDCHTLIKGQICPMFLGFSKIIGIPFQKLSLMSYIAACLMLVEMLSRFVRSWPWRALAFSFLLFNPVTYAAYTAQRLYRNGMVTWELTAVFCCFFLVYVYRNASARRVCLWALAGGVALWALLNTREDGLWIWPFVLTVLALSAMRSRFWGTLRAKLRWAGIALIPLAVLMLGNGLLAIANGAFYGRCQRNDRDSGYYAQVAKDLYLMEPDSEEDHRLSSPECAAHYHNISMATVRKACAFSPTLASASNRLEVAMTGWAKVEGYSCGELVYDHILFAIRNGAQMAGAYETLETSEAFFRNVHQELDAAHRAGRYRRRGMSFSAMAAPYQGQWRECLDSFWGVVDGTLHFSGLKAISPRSSTRFDKNRSNPLFLAMAQSSAGGVGDWRSAEITVAMCNQVIRCYAAVIPWLTAAAGAAFLGVLLVIVYRRLWQDELFDLWLFAAGILGSMLVHLACMSYVDATTFPVAYPYLVVSYQLELMFIVVSLSAVVKAILVLRSKPHG